MRPPCLHPFAARETVMLPNDEMPSKPIMMAGVRLCTACLTLIIHLGESVARVDVALADMT